MRLSRWAGIRSALRVDDLLEATRRGEGNGSNHSLRAHTENGPVDLLEHDESDLSAGEVLLVCKTLIASDKQLITLLLSHG